MVRFDTPQALQSWLVRKGIRTAHWGKGGAKRVTDLWSELVSGDCSLSDSSPLRLVTLVQVLVRRDDHLLLELEQQLASGQMRKRQLPPSEKMKPGESIGDAAVRCLEEELGLNRHEVVILGEQETYERTADAPSYPGLTTRYTVHGVTAAVEGLPNEDFWRDNTAHESGGDPVARHHWGWRPSSRLSLQQAGD